MENQKDERRIKALNHVRNVSGMVHIIAQAYGTNDFVGWLKFLEHQAKLKQLMNELEAVTIKRAIENHNVPMYKEGGPSRSHIDFEPLEFMGYSCVNRPEFKYKSPINQTKFT